MLFYGTAARNFHCATISGVLPYLSFGALARLPAETASAAGRPTSNFCLHATSAA